MAHNDPAERQIALIRYCLQISLVAVLRKTINVRNYASAFTLMIMIKTLARRSELVCFQTN